MTGTKLRGGRLAKAALLAARRTRNRLGLRDGPDSTGLEQGGAEQHGASDDHRHDSVGLDADRKQRHVLRHDAVHLRGTSGVAVTQRAEAARRSAVRPTTRSRFSRSTSATRSASRSLRRNSDGSDHATSGPDRRRHAPAAAPAPAATGCPTGTGTIAVGDLSLRLNWRSTSRRSRPVSSPRRRRRSRRISASRRVRRTARPGRARLRHGRAVQSVLGPTRGTTGADGTVNLSMNQQAGFPAARQQELLVMFVRARKPAIPSTAASPRVCSSRSRSR